LTKNLGNWSFHVIYWQRTAAKCAKVHKARADQDWSHVLLVLFIKLFFFSFFGAIHVLGAIDIVVLCKVHYINVVTAAKVEENHFRWVNVI